MKQLRMLRDLEQLPELFNPEGFTLRNFRPGDENVWVEICKHGLLEQTDGVECWARDMLSVPLVPEKDVFFFCDGDGRPVATFAGYVQENGVGNVHMVAARPEYKGRKLGWAMVTQILHKMKADMPEPGSLLGLRTDDWRRPACVGYLRGGFHPVLFDEGMQERWQEVCDRLNIHGIEMWDLEGNPTGIIL